MGRASKTRVEGEYHPGLAGTPWHRRRPALKKMFEEISSDYDRLNHLLSIGLDRGWRRWAARALEMKASGVVVDLASGTGDMAEVLSRTAGGAVLRCDLSAPLLRLGERKLAHGGMRSSRRSAPAVACEMERLPLRSASVDAVVQGFALRHCRSFDGFFAEIHRVLRPGGRVALLDMRVPAHGPFSRPYRFYFLKVLPRLAALLGGEREAYEMMVDSVRGLPPEDDLLSALRRAGFTGVESRPGFLGAVRLLVAERDRP